MESNSDASGLMHMIVEDAVLHYLDSAEEHEIPVMVTEDESVYINAHVVADVAERAYQLLTNADNANDDAIAGGLLVTDVVITLAIILARRGLEVGVGDILDE